METESGALFFKAGVDSRQMKWALEDVKESISGVSASAIKSGQNIDEAFAGAFEEIQKAFNKLDDIGRKHTAGIQSLEAEYKSLSDAAGEIFMKGGEIPSEITERQQAIQGEIRVRKKLIAEVDKTGEALVREEVRLEKRKKQLEANAASQNRLRTQLRNVKQDLGEMVMSGQQGTEAYARLSKEMERLQGAMFSVNKQAQYLTNLKGNIQGLVAGLSGLAGGLSAVTGAMTLFVGENEDLQKVMARVQGVMAITIGMQQVSQMLHKDSTFQQITLNRLRTWWAGIVAKGTKAEIANTAATVASNKAKGVQSGLTSQAAAATAADTAATAADTAAKGVNTVATKGATIANIGLAGAFRMVGAAIKSIPVIGWVLAGVGALITVIGRLVRSSKEAKKEQQELHAAIVDGAYQSIGAVESLSLKWAALGDDMEAKQKFIREHSKLFDELGVAVQDVADAERVLIDQKDAFIDAQVAKAKAAVYAQQAMELVKKIAEAELEAEKTDKYKASLNWWKWFTEGAIDVDVKDNKELAKLKEQIEGWREEYTALMGSEAEELEKAGKLLEDAGIKGAKVFGEGTIGALEQTIKEKREDLETLKNDNEAYMAALIELQGLEEQLRKLTSIDKEKAGKDDDPLIRELNERKKAYQEYAKWVSVGMGEEARAEFGDEIAKSSYLEYLNGLRDDATLTAEQVHHVLNEIANETKTTVIGEFEKTLKEQVAIADGVLGQLSAIQEARKALADDDPLKAEKEQKLDEAEQGVLDAVRKEYEAAMEEHSKYLDERVDADQRYFDRRKELQEQQASEDDPTKRGVIEMQIKALDTQYDTVAKKQYDKMLRDYESYQQKRKRVAAEFDKEIALATEQKNEELVQRIEEAKAKAIADVDIEELTSSEQWNKLFSNLDSLTVSEMIRMRDGIEKEWEKFDLPPDQLEAIRSKLNEVTHQIQQKNPFLALVDSIRRYKEEGSDVDFKEIAEDVAGVTQAIAGMFGQITGSLETLGVEMDDELDEVLNATMGALTGAADLAMGIASGNPLQIIQGSIDLIVSGITLIGGAKDRNLSRSIREHEQHVKNLEKAYSDLERQMDKALGSGRYDTQRHMLQNLKEQQEQYEAMAKAEEEKKKADQDKIDEYNEAAKENRRQMEDLVDGMREDILGMSVASAASELGNALIDAFAAGEDAAAAWGRKVDDIVGNIIRKMIIQKLVEEPVGKIINKYMEQWVDDDGNFLGFDSIMGSVQQMGEELTDFGKWLAEVMEHLPDDVKKFLTGDGAPKGLTGAVKGMSEETASLLSGYINAVRINQIEGIEVMREQLLSLNRIADNTSYNAMLPRIMSAVERLAYGGESLRSQGF